LLALAGFENNALSKPTFGAPSPPLEERVARISSGKILDGWLLTFLSPHPSGEG
jgi:hypothetical protein